MIPSARELTKHAKTLNKSKIRSYVQMVITTMYKTFNTEGTMELDRMNGELDYARQIVEPYGYEIVQLDEEWDNIYSIKPRKD